MLIKVHRRALSIANLLAMSATYDGRSCELETSTEEPFQGKTDIFDNTLQVRYYIWLLSDWDESTCLCHQGLFNDIEHIELKEIILEEQRWLLARSQAVDAGTRQERVNACSTILSISNVVWLCH